MLKVCCGDENEIKERLKKREKSFKDSPLNETPSWNTYLATKELTERLEKDSIPKELEFKIIEYNTLNNKSKLIYGTESRNIKKVFFYLEKNQMQ